VAPPANPAERVDSRITIGRLRLVTDCELLADAGSDPIRLPSMLLRLPDAGESTVVLPGLVIRGLATLDIEASGPTVAGVDGREIAGLAFSEDRL